MARATKPRVGRPSLSGAGVAAKIEVKVSPEARARYQAAAEAAGVTLSSWVRQALERAAG